MIRRSDSGISAPSPDQARSHPDLHALDEHAILGPDLVVELEVVGDPLLVGARQEEVVEPAVGALGSERHDRADREVAPAGHDVDRRAGEEQVELAAVDLARGVVDAAAAVLRRPVLARERRVLLEGVRAGGDVDRLREARVGDGAVVALEVVLDADLPVRLVLALRPLVEDERVDVDPALGDEPRQVAQVLGEAAGRGVGIDEDERPPGVDRDGDEAERVPVESRLAVPAWCRAQRPVEVVRPRVVGALQRLAPADTVAEQVAAVPADVHERAERVVAAADEDDRDVAGPGRDERPRFGQVPGVADVLPGAPEDPLLLESGHRRVDVPVPGDRAAAGGGRHGRMLPGDGAITRAPPATASAGVRPRRSHTSAPPRVSPS